MIACAAPDDILPMLAEDVLSEAQWLNRQGQAVRQVRMSPWYWNACQCSFEWNRYIEPRTRVPTMLGYAVVIDRCWAGPPAVEEW
jgi:hypothetical protein